MKNIIVYIIKIFISKNLGKNLKFEFSKLRVVANFDFLKIPHIVTFYYNLFHVYKFLMPHTNNNKIIFLTNSSPPTYNEMKLSLNRSKNEK